MGEPMNLIGHKYIKLLVLNRLPDEFYGKNKDRKRIMWNCLCECGNYKSVSTRDLRHGDIVSCGCVRETTLFKKNNTEYMKHIKKDIVKVKFEKQPKIKKEKQKRKQKPREFEYKGIRNTRIYTIWKNMKGRCYNKNNTAYKWYGEKGVNVCDEWKDNFEPFYNWAINNGYSDILTIDRINCYGNYEPSNCRWITLADQERNKRPREQKKKI